MNPGRHFNSLGQVFLHPFWFSKLRGNLTSVKDMDSSVSV